MKRVIITWLDFFQSQVLRHSTVRDWKFILKYSLLVRLYDSCSWFFVYRQLAVESWHLHRALRGLPLQFGVRNLIKIYTVKWFHVQCIDVITPFLQPHFDPGNLVYVALGRHTLIPVTIMILCQIPVYLGLCITWKTLRGTPSPRKSDENGKFPPNDVQQMEDCKEDEDVTDGKDVEVVEKSMYSTTSS